MASWAVVATCDEPVPLIAAFVAHHLARGAAEVRIYLDRPDPAAEALLAGRAGVHVTLCDAAYWAARGRRRPPSHVQRQMVNANHAFTQVRADWLLHCDADEFLSAPLDGVLAAVAPEVQVIGLGAVERCWLAGARPAHVFDGVFRAPLPKLTDGPQQVYGPDAAFMTRGVLAYVGCKSLTRVGTGLYISIHDSFQRGPGGGPVRKAKVARLRPWAPPGILHFDGLTRLHWVLKLTKYAQAPEKGRAAMLGPARSRQVEYVLAHRDAPGAAAALHDRLRVLSPEAAARLRDLGGLNEAGFDPRPAVAAMFPEHRFDFSEAGFDRRIRRRHPKLTASM